MENSVENINRLLASTCIKNNCLAFQILKGDPTLLTEAIFPLLAWRFFALDFDNIDEHYHLLKNTEIADDMLDIITVLEEGEDSLSESFYHSENSLDIFIERLDLYSKKHIKEWLEKIHPYLEIYNNYLQEDDYYIERILSVAREVYRTYNLEVLIYPFYYVLTTTDSLEIEDKVDFIKIILELSNKEKDKEKYRNALPIVLEYADNVITKQPIYAAEYHDIKGLLYRRYGEYKEAILSYENSHKLSPKKETVLNSLAWLLLHTDRQAEAYAHATKAVRTKPMPDHINTLAHLELIYKGNKTKSKELFEKVLEIDPNHLNSIKMLEKINNKKYKKWL